MYTISILSCFCRQSSAYKCSTIGSPRTLGSTPLFIASNESSTPQYDGPMAYINPRTCKSLGNHWCTQRRRFVRRHPYIPISTSTDGGPISDGGQNPRDRKYAAISTSAGARTKPGAAMMAPIVDDNTTLTLARDDSTTSSVSRTC